MTTEQIDQARAAIGFTNPASPEMVTDALKAARQIERQADQATRRLLSFLPPIVRRLLDAETERNTLRTTIARLVVANNHGNDYSLSDVAWELQQAGVDLKHEYAEAEDLHRATAGEATL
ncbi:hypothetical protein [Streptomyces umbrinus]|uniref:hypothetical protein n=1 Tax=Streptomyces umbrinus TaxID=67370 RepID=UPI003C2E1B93